MHPVVEPLAILLLGGVAISGAAYAQPVEDLPSMANGQLLDPRHGVRDTMLALYDGDLAIELGRGLPLLRQAAERCENSSAWYREYRRWWEAIDRKRRETEALGQSANRDPYFRGQAREDGGALHDYVESSEFPLFVNYCGPARVARPHQPGVTFPQLGDKGMGLPEQKIEGLPLAVYNEAFAKSIGDVTAALRQAVKTCNAPAYKHGRTVLERFLVRRSLESLLVQGGDIIACGQALYDLNLVETYLLEHWIQFPACTPPR